MNGCSRIVVESFFDVLMKMRSVVVSVVGCIMGIRILCSVLFCVWLSVWVV